MKLICFCGIDGSGKSSIINNFKKIYTNNYYIFKAFNYRENVNKFIIANPEILPGNIQLYTKFYRRALLEAYILDFMYFFKIEIEPLLESDHIIICDRWYHCILAFALCLNIKNTQLLNSFIKIPKGDLIFHIKSDPLFAYKRQKFSTSSFRKELTLLEEYANGYNTYFEVNKLNTIIIENLDINISTQLVLNSINDLITN
ncbi:MAG: hypothetical protein WBP41_04385 [Saprospiraceae bacterium]